MQYFHQILLPKKCTSITKRKICILVEKVLSEADPLIYEFNILNKKVTRIIQQAVQKVFAAAYFGKIFYQPCH